jgi:peptidoglycan/LPS O-acetylase OafA/YrhL
MRDYIPSLNGLRAVSITIVIFFHLMAANSFGALRVPFPFTIFVDGNFGVNVFFVISGFLITTLLMAEENKYGAISLKNFYIRRIFRIFPAYFFVLFVYLILQLFSVLYFTRQSWLSSIFYYKYFVRGDTETAHFWSLSVEEHFYLVWPLIFLLFRRTRAYFAFGIILLVLICRTFAYYNILHIPILGDWAFIFQRVDAIMIGCLFAMYRYKLSSWMDKCMSLKFLPLFLLVLFINSRYLVDWNGQYGFHLGFLLVPLGIGLSVGTLTNLLIAIVMLFSINYKTGWYRFLNLPAMNYIGRLSYSLYLWQQLFIMSDKLGVLNKFPLSLICGILAALISYYFVELPFLRLKSNFHSGGMRNKLVAVPAK